MTSPTADDMPSLLESLAAQLRSDLLVRGDAASKEKFDHQRERSWNKDLSIRAEPIAFAMVSGVKDVVTAIKFCAQHDIDVTVRGKGAHSPWGMAQVRKRRCQAGGSHTRERSFLFSSQRMRLYISSIIGNSLALHYYFAGCPLHRSVVDVDGQRPCRSSEEARLHWRWR